MTSFQRNTGVGSSSAKNVDENPQTAMEYKIMSIPMQMFFANGQKVAQILGAVPEHAIRSKVEEILKRFPTDQKGVRECF